MSVTKMFTIALFIAFGTLLFSCTDNKGITLGEIAIEQIVKPETIENKEDTIPIVGQMMATIPPIETIDCEIATHYETHVAGGISIQHDYVIENILPIDSPIIDSPIADVPKPEEMIMGAMIYVPQIPDSVISEDKLDSLVIKKQDDVKINDIILDFIVYPNPTKGEFTIKYDLKKRSDILIDIVDINGVGLRTIVNIQGQHTGKYQVPVDLTDLPNGIYFVNLTNEGKRRTQKVILEK